MTDRVAVGVVLILSAGLAVGQNTPAKPAAPAAKAEQPAASSESLMDDFGHYVRIARYDLAKGFGEELLRRAIQPTDFVKVVEGSRDHARFDDTISRAMRVPDLESTAAKILSLYNTGKLNQARDPKQIEANITALTGTMRGRLDAQDRLVAAGEYAVPQLLAAYLDGSKPARQAESQRVLIMLGRQSISPLCTALGQLPAAEQEAVSNLLGQIPYRTSLPALVDLNKSSTNDAVKAATKRAIDRLAQGATIDDPAALHYQLADAYYFQKSEVTSFPGEDHQLLWSYDPRGGLMMQAIATPVFHEAMAMRHSKRALELRPEYREALALWIASNFKRENETPAGYDNPAYPKTAREAMYFSVASGADVSQMVLARGLDTRDTNLSRRALAAVEKTAGVNSLKQSGRVPLVDALTYPNRRVQYEAALAIAAGQPKDKFAGSERVIPTLSGAIREASAKFAAVVAPNNDQYQSYRRMLEKAGYTVLPFGKTVAETAPAVAESPAVDLFVLVSPNGADTGAAVTEVRGNPRLIATPVMVVVGQDVLQENRRRFESDSTVAVRSMAITEEQTIKASEELITTVSGGHISADEAKGFSARALSALRDLAISGGGSLDVGEAATPLIAALPTATGATKTQVAEVLARINQARAQVALMDAALAAKGDDQVQLMGKVSDSAKRFGNQLEERQTRALVQLATESTDAGATAAAALMGSLNLPNAKVLPLITGKK